MLEGKEKGRERGRAVDWDKLERPPRHRLVEGDAKAESGVKAANHEFEERKEKSEITPAEHSR